MKQLQKNSQTTVYRHLLLLVSLVHLFSCTSTPEQPNIILCMADDQGWGDVGYYSHPVLKTPNLDEMASAALRFDHFYAAAPVCSPTRGSVMTGRNPNRFGCFSWGRTLRPQEITIAEMLKKAGYSTGHFGKWHLGSVRKNSPVNPGASGFDEWLSAENFYDNDPILSQEGIAVQLHGESSMIIADAAVEYIKKKSDSGKPFFTVVWFGSPHNPHIASDQNKQLYEGQPEKFKEFYGEISGIDQAMGKIRKTLREMDIQGETILWYCSDNGGLPNLSRTGGRKYKGSIYEGGLRVPAIMEWPGKIPSPGSVKIPCTTSDIFPTIMDILNIEPDTGIPLDGISLMPAINGKTDHRSQPIGFWQRPAKGHRMPSKDMMQKLLEKQAKGNMIGDSTLLRLDAGEINTVYSTDSFPGHAAWLSWPWKLHRIQKGDSVHFELYNLVEDSLEMHNKFNAENQKSAEMNIELEYWMESVISSLNGEDYSNLQ